METKRKFYYVLIHPSAVYVKTEQFFTDQGGQHAEWGKAWRKIEAESIDDARAKGLRMRDA